MQIVELKVNVEKSQLDALAAEVEKLNGKVINFKTSTGGTGGASPTAGMNKGFKETQQQAEKTGQSIVSVMGKVAKWTAVTTAVYAPVKAFKEALTTLKAVDSELVQVQKVTNFSQRQMKEIEQQAYKTASAYGVSADKYTESVAAFARAGYKEQSAALAELSTKTQLVGDTTAEVANQFLLSTDAAYKYNGSVQQLSRVLDGANELDNNYATSIEKIAEGMGLVAPVAAQAGIGVDELMASLGTITAVTQRSGAEAARAYRALVLNILGDTKTEIADGATWTAGEIEGLRDVLKTYAPEAVKAAEATGDIINPMKAMEGLSQAMKDGVLTEQKLMEMVSDIGGKLRTSQLLALIQNWDMYESMLKDFQNAAGSADKEVENAMNSWERKTEVLKNTWTEFVSHMVDTDLIKGGLDAVTGFVEVLDSGFGQAAIKAGAFALAMNGITKGLMALAGTTVVRDLGAFVSLLSTEGVAAFGALSATLTPLMAISALSADFMFMAKAVDDAYVSLEEQADIVTDLKTQYEQLTGAGSEYAQLMDQVGTGGLTEQERARLTVLNAQADALERQIKLEEERQFKMFQQQESGTFQLEHGQMVDTGVGKTGDVKRLEEMNKLYEEGYEKVKKGESSLEDYRGVLQNIIADNSDWYEQMKEWEDLGFGDSFTDAQKEAMDLYETIAKLLNLGDEDLPIVKALDKLDESGMGMTDFANKTVVDAAQIRQAFADAGMGIEETNAAIEALRNSGDIVIDVQNDNGEQTLQNLEELGIAVKDADGWKIDINGLEDLAGKLGLSKTEADNLVKALDGIDGVNFDGVADSVGVIYDSVQSLIASNPTIEVNATDNASGVIQTVENEKETVSQPTNTPLNVTDNASGPIQNDIAQARLFGDMHPKPTISVNDRATGVLSGIVGLISSIRDKSVTIMTKFVQQGSPNGYAPTSIIRSAVGSVSFKGGPTLLGDELSSDGSPRPELVITKSGAFIAGMNGPVMTSLPAGSRIFKYSDTMDIMSGGDLTQLQAFSLGDDYLRGKNKPQSTPIQASQTTSKPSTSSGSSGSRSSSGGSSSRSGGRSSGRSSGSSGSSGGGGGGSSADTLKEELELLESQYSFLEASNASTDELWAKSDEIKNKLHEINEALRVSGGEEKDIVDNSTKWWQEVEKQRGLLEDELSLLEAQYGFLEESGASAEDLNAKSAEIQDKLHEINELARATGGNQEDILATSQKWWQELKKIHEVQRKVYQDERDLLETQYNLMEHQGRSAGERIAKLREIQDNLHQEAEYMRSIKADQAEINQLSIQWWETQKDILSIQKALTDELKTSISADYDRQRKANDARIKAIEDRRDAELEALKDNLKYKDLELDVDQSILDVKQAEADEAERYNKLLEARKNLENALHDRTVRYYNAETGHWEWGPDAKKVKQAQDDLKQAEQDYKDAQKNTLNKEYEADKKRIEDQAQREIDAIEKENDRLSEMEDALDEIFAEPLRDIVSILKDMYATNTISKDQLLKLYEQGIITKDQLDEIINTIKSWGEFKAENPTGTFADYVAQSGSPVNVSDIPNHVVETITDNPDAVWAVTDENGNRLDSQGNQGSGTPGVSWTTTSSGGTGSYGGGTSSGSSSGSYSGGSSSGGGSSSFQRTGKKKTYDSGGILTGLGGIKATSGDEIVIPPDLAEFMLKPSASKTFQARVSELAYLYGSKPLPGTLSNNRSSNDHYGDTYTFGNVTLTEDKAKRTTVYELAQMSRSLGIYRNA